MEPHGSSSITAWDPYSFFDRAVGSSINLEARKPPQFALLILNQEISDEKRFEALWENSTVRVCADGGANRLFDFLRNDEQLREKYLPDGIFGDLDSLREDTKLFYEARGVKVSRNPDQDSTDFGKCMEYIATCDGTIDAISGSDTKDENKKLAVVALGGFGGRVDQSFHSVQTLYASRQEPGASNRQIFLSSDQNITFLLNPGTNILQTPRSAIGPSCGIFPLGTPSTITTRGFEWNLEGAETRFGGLVSTSNHTVDDVVHVETTEPVLFTIEFREDCA